jgi:hypothetical protein
MFQTLSVRSGAPRRKPRQQKQRCRGVRRSTARPRPLFYDVPQLQREPRLEVFLLLWDEMDDWLGAARHLLRSLT